MTTPDGPGLLDAQGYNDSTPLAESAEVVTSPINPPQATEALVVNFDPDVYDLSPESHLSRLLKVLLGDAGAGQLRKRMTLARLESVLYATASFNLDSYAGSLLGFQRMNVERSGISPVTDVADPDEWDAQEAQDAQYLSRLEQFMKAIPYGGTRRGIIQAAQALFGVEVDVYETYIEVDNNGGSNAGGTPSPVGARTYGDVEDDFVYYGDMEGQTYGAIEGGSGSFGRTTTQNRNEFIVVPKRTLSAEEVYHGIKTLSVIKPVFALLTLDPNGIEIHTPVTMRGVSADSTYWEILSKVAAKPGTEKSYQRTDPSGKAVIQPKPKGGRYQGEAWSYTSDITSVTSYTEDANGGHIADHDFRAIRQADKKLLSFTPDLGVASAREILSGRIVSDGVLVAMPYSADRAPGFSPVVLHAPSP